MRGDPNNCAGGGGCFQSIIGTASPVSIAAQGQAEVSLTWVFDGVQVIYGIIDPMNIITGITLYPFAPTSIVVNLFLPSLQRYTRPIM